MPTTLEAQATPAQDAVFDLLLATLAEDRHDEPARLRQQTAAEWAALAAEAERQGVAPLLLRRLEQRQVACPAAIIAALTEVQWRTGVANMQAFEQVLDFAAALHPAGIAAIALKGIHLAQVVYGNVSLRPMTDLDFLVNLADLPRVEAILEQLGYRPYVEQASRAWYLANHYHVDYYKRRADAKLFEVHWHLVRPGASYRIDLDGLWQRAQPALVATTPLIFLAPEDLLLHLCLQMTHQHLFDYYPVRLLCDVVAILQHYRAVFDWPGFAARARRWNAAHSVYLTLATARTLLGAAVPAATLDALRLQQCDPLLDAYARRRMRDWRSERNIVATSDGFGALWAAPSLSAKFRAAASVVFPSPTALATRYLFAPGGLPLLRAYPRHWLRLVRRHAGTTWRLIRQEPSVGAWASKEAERLALTRWLQQD